MSEHAADVKELLEIGRSIRLHLNDGDANRSMDSFEFMEVERQGHHSRILKLLPEEIVISWPIELNTQAMADVGQTVVLEIKNERGIASLSSHITATTIEPVSALHVARTGEWSWKQLRLNVRLDVSIIGLKALLVPNVSDDGPQGGARDSKAGTSSLRTGPSRGTPIQAAIRDLSAGGVLLASPTQLETGALLRIHFALGKGDSEISALARVVWIGEDEAAKKYSHKAGCQFLNLTMGDQDKIVKYIFSKQAELRRWGLI